ncbi:MAG: hypothetical protein JSU01_13925 [Bacteroidetes bacterium]|nr:hypothetical protein [Bacteroidota bacterium]
MRVTIRIALLLIFTLTICCVNAQDRWKALEKRPATLGLEKGYLSFNVSGLRLKLVRSSQTVAALSPAADTTFDFTPGERLRLRSSDGMYHLGDLDLRLRFVGDTAWKKYVTAGKRAEIAALPLTDSNTLAAADLANTLPPDIPLHTERYWKWENGHLVLLFRLKNISARVVEIGSLGIPVIFNNILQGKSLEQAHAENVFYDPYIGMDAGYLQVTRLSGHGPALLVVPYGHTPFEAYNPIRDATPLGMDFEGFYEWMAHSKAYAENEWKKAEPWNPPSFAVLQPGETREYGLEFLLADSIKGIEQILAENKRPVAVGVPGYVLPQDVDAKLFLKYPSAVKSITAEPEGALLIEKTAAENNDWQAYMVKGRQWGRARLTIVYEDGLVQTVNYKVIKPEAQVLKDYGHFLLTKQWFTNKNDPFDRNPSVITYDYEKRQQVTQDARVWIAGLSDEGGAGSWLGAMMKQLVQPDQAEIAKLQLFVDHTLWGNIQYSTGPHKYGVKKSVFYYQPDQMPKGTYSDSINWKTWAAWSHKDANDVGRSYDYPHVAAAHWVMYRLSRYHTGLITQNSWQWYLTNAYQTAMAMVKQAPYYAQFGQMEGTVFCFILNDLKAEGWYIQAEALEQAMKARADHWHSLQYPFGSEMPWDSTGQEEVYAWSVYFGYNDKAKTTINAILGYMPTLPHWGYNGSARRYWDFLYAGKLSRIERQLHHYGSGLNAIPILSEYRSNPADLYLLRVGYGGLMGSISNITQDGFGPAAFHSYPSTLKIDGLSGDYGPNFFGYAVNAATYITDDKTLGWLAFGGNLTKKDDLINVEITNGAKSRIFIAPLKLWLTLDAGAFKSVSFNPKSGHVTLVLDAADKYTPKAYLHLLQNGTGKQQAARYRLIEKSALSHGAYVIALKNRPIRVNLTRTGNP